MENWEGYIGACGGSGLLAMLLTWFRAKAKYENKVDNIIQDLEGLKKRVRFTDTCLAMYEGIKERLINIESMQKETRNDIKTLLKRNGIHINEPH